MILLFISGVSVSNTRNISKPSERISETNACSYLFMVLYYTICKFEVGHETSFLKPWMPPDQLKSLVWRIALAM
jgi:hypothetical protein